MPENACQQCGAAIAPGATECKYCGEPIKQFTQPVVPQQAPQQFQQQPVYQQPQYQQPPYQQPPYQQAPYQQPPYPQAPYQQGPYQQGPYQQPPMGNMYNSYGEGINPGWPIKNKIVAGILGIFLGGIGVHKFYMGKVGLGILYLLFCWTGIPAIIGFIEGIIYLCSNDHNFQVKNQVRLQ